MFGTCTILVAEIAVKGLWFATFLYTDSRGKVASRLWLEDWTGMVNMKESVSDCSIRT